jgi:lipoyl(octanoyl) transferase
MRNANMKVEYNTDNSPVEYLDAINFMEQRIADIHNHKASEMLWFLEHPPIYTAGTNSNPSELLNLNDIPTYQTGRGGKHTYHGPGQRIIYLMLDLRAREQDLRKYVANVEDWVIASLKELGLTSMRKEGRIGIWTESPLGEAKIAAIGIRVRKWITYHGVSINVNPDLEHYKGIIPCGIKEFGVTSLKQLGYDISYRELDDILKSKFHDFF